MEDRQWLILYVVVCLEVGLFLALVPWSVVWERNFFLEAYPALRPILLAPVIRGAVTGLGVANVYMGFREILNRRRAAELRTGGVAELRRETLSTAGAEGAGAGGRAEDREAIAGERRR
jgi:hypothetical protein